MPITKLEFSNPPLQKILQRQRKSKETLFFRRMFTMVELDLDVDESEVEPCRHKWRREDREANKEEEEVNSSSVCGGVGSCLYCGHQCSSIQREADSYAAFKFFKRNVAGKRRQLRCGSGLRKDDRDFAVKFCLPNKNDFFSLIGISERDFNQIFTNGKEFFVKAYVFYADKTLRERAALVQNKELRARRAQDDFYKFRESEKHRLQAKYVADCPLLYYWLNTGFGGKTKFRVSGRTPNNFTP